MISLFARRATQALLLTSIAAHTACASDALYYSLDHTSLSDLLTYHQLFPDSPLGQEALHKALQLVGMNDESVAHFPSDQFPHLLPALVALTQHIGKGEQLLLSETQIRAVETLCAQMPNRNLKGYTATSLEQVAALPSEQVDLSRALILAQQGEEWTEHSARSYSALIDALALQVLCRLPADANDMDKVEQINHLIFHELRFRFPPHRVAFDQIDDFSHLGSVLDNRRGVCLGVSLLYLCIAQRLDLELEIVTPPGHIYVRLPTADGHRNIETTARGIHLPDELYLGLNNRILPSHDIKEAVGMIFQNQGTSQWKMGDHAEAAASYRNGLRFMPDYPLLQKLLGFQLLILGEESEGRNWLRASEEQGCEEMVTGDRIGLELLNGTLETDALHLLFGSDDQTRAELLERRSKLEQLVQRCPKSFCAQQTLAFCQMALGNIRAAEACLDRCHTLYPHDCQVEAALMGVSLERANYPKAWTHYKQLERVCAEADHQPKQLRHMRRTLETASPPALHRYNGDQVAEIGQ